MRRLAWLLFVALETQGKDVTKVTVLDGHSGFTLLDGGGRGGGGGGSRGGTIMGDKRFGGRLRLAASNATGSSSKGKGGDLELLSGYGFTTSGRAALVSADGAGNTGDLLVRSGQTLSSSEAATLGINVPQEPPAGGSGDVTLGSGSALCAVGGAQNAQEAPEDSRVGRSGDVAVVAGYAWHRGGNVLLSGGNVTAPRDLLDAGAYEAGSSGEAQPRLPASVTQNPAAGSVLLRGGSVLEGGGQVQGGVGWGGDVDLAPGAAWVPHRNAPQRHGRVVVRDHNLEERLVVNHSHTQLKGRAVTLHSMEGGLRALAMEKRASTSAAAVATWASFAACRDLPGGAAVVRQGVEWHAVARRRCSGLGLSSEGKGWLMASGALRLAAGGGDTARKDHPAARFMGADDDEASHMATQEHVDEDSPDGPLDLVLEAGAVRTKAQFDLDELAMIPAESKPREPPLGVGEGNGGAIRLTAGKGGDSPGGNRGGALALVSGAGIGNLGWSGAALLATGYADGVCISSEDHAKQGHVSADQRKPLYGTGTLNLRSGDTTFGRQGERGSGGQSGAVQLASGRGEFSGSVTVSAGPAYESSGDVALLGGDHIGSQYAKQQRRRERGVATSRRGAGALAGEEDDKSMGRGGSVRIRSGSAVGGDSGPVWLESAEVGQLGPLASDEDRSEMDKNFALATHVYSGAVRIRSGKGGKGAHSGSGDVTVASGSAQAEGGTTGSVRVSAGDSVGGQGGSVTIQSGGSGDASANAGVGADGRNTDGNGGIGGKLQLRSGSGPWGSGRVVIGSGGAHQSDAVERPTSGGVEIATGLASGQAGAIQLRTGNGGGGVSADEPSLNSISLLVGQTVGNSKGGAVVVKAGSSDFGIGGDVEVASGMGRGAFGTNQHLKSGGTLKLMVGDQPRFVANGSHITTSAPMGLDARIGEKLMFSVGGGEGGGPMSPRRALLLLDTGSRSSRLLLAARGLSGGLGLRVDPAPEDSVGGDLKMQTGDVGANFGRTGAVQILTGSSLRGNVSTGAVFVETGECKESGSSGQLLLRTGNVQHGYRAGVISLKGGDANALGEALGAGGSLRLESGHGDQGARGGNVHVEAGSSYGGSGGSLNLLTGNSTYHACHGYPGRELAPLNPCGSGVLRAVTGYAAAGSSGAIELTTGDAAEGDTGSISLAVGKSTEGQGGGVSIAGGSSNQGRGGALRFISGEGAGSDVDDDFGSGDATLVTAPGTVGRAYSGRVSVVSGDSVLGTSGNVTLRSGNAGGGAGDVELIGGGSGGRDGEVGDIAQLSQRSGGSVRLSAGASVTPSSTGVGGSVVLTPGLGGMQLAVERANALQQYEHGTGTARRRNQPIVDRDPGPFDGQIELRAATGEQRIVANSSTVALSAPNLNFAAEQYDLKFSSPRSMQVAVGSAQLNVNADSGWRPDGSGNQEGKSELLSAGALRLVAGCPNMVEREAYANGQRREKRMARGGHVEIFGGGANVSVEGNGGGWDLEGGEVSILSGSGGGRGKGGALKLASGGANRSKSGDVSLASGFVHSDDGVSGDLTIATGAAGSSDDAGKVHRLAASAHALVGANAEDTKVLDHESAAQLAALAPTGSTGALFLATGNAAHGHAGPVEVAAGISGFGAGAHVHVRGGRGGRGLLFDPPQGSGRRGLGPFTPGGGPGSGEGGSVYIRGGEAASWRTGQVQLETPFSHANASGGVRILTGFTGLGASGHQRPDEQEQPWLGSGNVDIGTGASAYGRAGDVTLAPGESNWPRSPPADPTLIYALRRGSAVTARGGYARGDNAVGGSMRVSSGGGTFGSGPVSLRSANTNHSNGGVLLGAPSGPVWLRSGNTWAGRSGDLELRSGDSRQDMSGSVVIKAGKSKALSSHLTHRAALAGELAGVKATKAGEAADVASTAARLAYLDTAQAGGVHLAAGDADAALGGDVCIDAGRGGLGAASVAPPHEGDDDDDDEYDEDEAEFNGGSSGRVRATAAGDDPEADSKAARRKIRAAAIAQQRALAKAEGEVSGYGAQGDGSVRVRVRGGDATRLLCSSSVVNITAPQVDVHSGRLGLLISSSGNTSLVSGNGRAHVQLFTDGRAEVVSTGTSTVTLRSRASSRASGSPSSSSSSSSSSKGSDGVGNRIAGGLLLAVDETVVANTVTTTTSGAPTATDSHALFSGGWINLTAGAAVGVNGGGLRLESGETTRGPMTDQTETDTVPLFEGSSGSVSITSGQAKHGHSGTVNLATGSAWSKQGRSGSLELKSGDAPQGAAGKLMLSAGSSQVIEATVLSSRAPVVRSTSNGDGAILIQGGKRLALPAESSFKHPLTHGGEVVMRSGASDAGPSGTMRVMSASAPTHSGFGSGAVTLTSGSALSSPKGANSDVTLLKHSTSGAVVMASGPAAGRSGDVAIMAGVAGALDPGGVRSGGRGLEQPDIDWWASEQAGPSFTGPGGRPLPNDRPPTVSGSSARGGAVSLSGGPSGGGLGGKVAVTGGGGLSGGGSVQISGGAAGEPFGLSLHDHPHGYSASALADADAADALAAWRSSHNDNNNDASSSANEDNEDEEEEEVSSTAKGSAGTVKLRGGDAFGVLLPPVQAQADASCVKAERAYVEAAAAAAGGRDVVELGSFGSFTDGLSQGQVGRIPRGGGAVLVAGSAKSGGVGGNATVGGGDGYFGGGHVRVRGGSARGPNGGLTRGGDVEMQGGLGAGSNSGGAVRILSADGSRRLEASDHAFAVTAPLLDFSATTAESSSARSQSVAMRLDRLGVRLRAAFAAPHASSSSTTTTRAGVALELDLNSETGAVFLGHSVTNSGSGSGDAQSTASIGNVTLVGANAVKTIAYGTGGASMIATRGPLSLSSAQRGTLSTVSLNYARRLDRLSQHSALEASLSGHNTTPQPSSGPTSEKSLAESAIALAPGGGSGVGIGPAFAASTLAPRALLHVVASATSPSNPTTGSSSSSDGSNEESVNWNGPGEAERAANLAGLPLVPPKNTIAAFQAPGPAAVSLLAGGANATLWLQTQALHYPSGTQRPRPNQIQGFIRVTSSSDLATAAGGKSAAAGSNSNGLPSALLALGVGDGSQSGVVVDAAGRVGVGGGFSTSSLEPSSPSNLRPAVPLHVRSASSKVSEGEAKLASSLAPPGSVAKLEERGPASLHLVSHLDPRAESPSMAGSLLFSSLDEAKGRGEHWFMGHRSTGEVGGGAGGLVIARRTTSSSSSSSSPNNPSGLSSHLATSLAAPLAGARASTEWRGSSGKDLEDGSSGSGSDGGVDPPSLWLDNQGRVGVGGFGPPRAALSVGGAAEAFDFRIAADDAVIGSSREGGGGGGQKQALREVLPPSAYATALALVSGVELHECAWDAVHTNPASEGSYEQRRRLGFHLGANGVLGKESPGSSSRTSPYRTYLCASAQQVEKAAAAAATAANTARTASTEASSKEQGLPGNRIQTTEQTAELFARSLVSSDEKGVRSLSVGRLALLLTAAVKELTSKLDHTTELILDVNKTLTAVLAAQDSRTDAISAHLFGKDNAPTTTAPATNAASSSRNSRTGYVAQAAQVEARVAALEAAAVAAAEEARVEAAARAAAVAAEEEAAQRDAVAAEAAKASAAEAARVAEASEKAARTALENRVIVAEAKTAALTEELARWREDANVKREQEQALQAAELNKLKAELTASTQTIATTSQTELKELKKEVALASAAAKSAVDATSGPAAQAAAKAAEESAAAAATAAATASAAEAEKGALRQYYLEEVARLEAVKRATGAEGHPPGTLSPADRNAARDEALAAVRERQADLKRLRDMGI